MSFPFKIVSGEIHSTTSSGVGGVIHADEFISELHSFGFGPFAGVPCSYLKGLIGSAFRVPHSRYFAMNNEGEAVAFAAGSFLAGRMPVVLMQNSGLGNAVNPLTSLAHTCRIPVLLLISLRGEPGGGDAPQHELMGRITTEMLDLLEIRHEFPPRDKEGLKASLEHAAGHMREVRLPYAFIIRKNAVYGDQEFLPDSPEMIFPVPALHAGRTGESAGFVSMRDAIPAVCETVEDDDVIISTTGKTSRELFSCCDRPLNFYVTGSMGCASSVALGVALHSPRRRIMVFDGDGAALMRMEALASIGYYKPPNMVHIILDNGVYASTGGQPTLSRAVDFTGIAAACGYATVQSVNSDAGLSECVRQTASVRGPHLIHALIAHEPGSLSSRPNLQPYEMVDRFREALGLPVFSMSFSPAPVRTSPARHILLNPGPVMLNEKVRRALTLPDICHREPEFADLMTSVRRKIVLASGGDESYTSVLLTGSGTAALEAAVAAIVSRGEVLVLSNGHYGERLIKLVEARKTECRRINFGWGVPYDIRQIEQYLAENDSISHILMVHHETSTGMLNPLSGIGNIAKRFHRSLCVDAISSLGGEHLNVRNDHIQWCIGTANKCLEGAPGISFVVAERNAIEQTASGKTGSLYFDLNENFRAQEYLRAPLFTPAIQVVYALNAALDLFFSEGLEARISRYRSLALRIRAGLEKIGIRPLLAPEHQCSTLTTFHLPNGISYDWLHSMLKKRGFVIYAGQGALENRMFRLANMGAITIEDIDRLIEAFGEIIEGQYKAGR